MKEKSPKKPKRTKEFKDLSPEELDTVCSELGRKCSEILIAARNKCNKLLLPSGQKLRTYNLVVPLSMPDIDKEDLNEIN